MPRVFRAFLQLPNLLAFSTAVAIAMAFLPTALFHACILGTIGHTFLYSTLPSPAYGLYPCQYMHTLTIQAPRETQHLRTTVNLAP